MKLTKEKTVRYIKLILEARQDQLRPVIRDIARHNNLNVQEFFEFNSFYKQSKDLFKITINLKNESDYSLLDVDIPEESQEDD